MNNVLKEYYENLGVMPFLIEDKLRKLEKHNAIEKEFEYWILNKKFKDEVHIEGYTASEIASISPYLNGEATFMILVELYENPEKAKQRIENGFKLK